MNKNKSDKINKVHQCHCGRDCWGPVQDEVSDTQIIPKTNIPNQIYIGPCLACNGFHPIGMACPTWKITSEGE